MTGQIEEGIKKLAEGFVQTMARFGMSDVWDYSERSIFKIDKYITENWGGEPPILIGVMVLNLGGYLGYVISKTLKSSWVDDDEYQPSLKLHGKVEIKFNPFHMIHKRFVNGEEDSIGYKYSLMKTIYEYGWKEDMSGDGTVEP